MMARAFPVHTPVRFAIYPWVATVTQGSAGCFEGKRLLLTAEHVPEELKVPLRNPCGVAAQLSKPQLTGAQRLIGDDIITGLHCVGLSQPAGLPGGCFAGVAGLVAVVLLGSVGCATAYLWRVDVRHLRAHRRSMKAVRAR